MRTRQEIETVLELVAAGVNDCAISRQTGIPRPTVRDWRRGGGPRLDRHFEYVAGRDPGLAAELHPVYAYLLGLYLGDGCLSPGPRSVYRLRITLDGAYPGIVAECKAAIETLMPNRVNVLTTASRAVEVTAFSKRWIEFFPQHGPGPKHLRPVRLLPWQQEITVAHAEQLVRGLIHSDGSRFTNPIRHRGRVYEYPRYTFCNASVDIRGIFCDHLDILDIPWSRMNERNISVAQRAAVARLDEFVGPKA